MDPSWTYSLNNGQTEYGGVNFHASLNSQANGNLDTTDTIFSYDVWVYYTDLTNINQLEFDLNQVLLNSDQTTDVIQFATQCNLSAGNFGSYFDPGLSGYWNYTVNGNWTKEPNIPCNRSDWTENQWHHVIVSFHRGPHTSKGHDIVCYDSVYTEFAGTKNFSSNAYGNQALSIVPSWEPPGLLDTNFQLDMGFTADGQTTAYADLMKVSSPPSYGP